jgi:hypothetical protein
MHAMSLGRLNKVFSRNGWKRLGIEQLECVTYGVVYVMFYWVDSEKVLINEEDHQDCELHRFFVETHPGRS